MDAELKVLVLEDVAEDAELVLREIKRGGFRFSSQRVETRPDYIKALENFRPDIILSDFSMASFDGLSALELTRKSFPDIPFIFVSGTIGEERAIEALKLGATDYVLKSNLARLVPSIRRALKDINGRVERQKMEKELKASEERFSSFMQFLPGVTFIKDIEGKYVYANAAWKKIFNKDTNQIIGKTDDELWSGDVATQLKNNDRIVRENKKPMEVIEMVPAGDEKHQWLVNKFSIPDPDGTVKMIGGIAIDITDRIVQEEKIARLTRIHAVLSSINSTIVRIHDRNELFHEACRIAVEQGKFGLAWIGLLEQNTSNVSPAASVTWDGSDASKIISDRSSKSNLKEGQGIVGQCLRNKKPVICNDIEKELDKGFRRKEALGKGFHSIIALPLLIDGNSTGVLVLYAKETHFFDDEELDLLNELAGDISFALEYIQKTEKLNYLAYYEPTTGLANRTLFLERLKQYINSAKFGKSKLAVMLLDLDRFKVINDTMGWHAGDLLLRMISDRLANYLGARDKLAHIGADHFAIVFPGIKGEADVGHILEKEVMSCFNKPFAVDDNEIKISAKYGISVFPTDGDNEDILFKNAEVAIKKAKDTGETYVFYTQEMTDLITEKIRLENKLAAALKQNEFVLYYQPKLEIATGKICGLEALIRWNNPEEGLIPPNKFIPILEDTGLIIDAGMWVIDKAASDYRNWQKELGHVPRIAVNVSPLQLKQKNFAEQVERAIRWHGKPVTMDIEITEGIIMDDIEQNISKLKSIRMAGLGVAIDDFGTGYSSLSYITRLPVDALKIDQSFIFSMTEKTESMSIVSTVITLAHSLNLKVIAEGVETEEQKKLLMLLKCDEMQGYLFSKPLPSEEIPALLKKYQ